MAANGRSHATPRQSASPAEAGCRHGAFNDHHLKVVARADRLKPIKALARPLGSDSLAYASRLGLWVACSRPLASMSFNAERCGTTQGMAANPGAPGQSCHRPTADTGVGRY